LIVDGSSKGDHGADFVSDWIRQVIDRISEQGEIIAKTMIRTMELAHIQLREKYILETACFSALLIRRDLNQAWGIVCGDCRIGRRNAGEIEWLTPVHTMANFIDDDTDRNSIDNPNRHIVTRCLNAKRFMAPEILELDYSATARWVLATDGYWVEKSNHQSSGDGKDDDASSLDLTVFLHESIISTDCCNWYERVATKLDH